MTKYFLISILLLLVQPLLAQESGSQNIPGTRVFLTVPIGFKISNSITGLEKNDDVGIIVMDLRGGNFSSNTATFTEDNWNSKVDTVLSFKEYEIQGFLAKKVHVQMSEINYIAVVFGDSTFSTMITAMAPIEDSVSLKQIEISLKSIKYDKTLEINSLEIAKFTLDESNSPYKFVRHSSTMYVYNKSGKKDSDSDASSFMVNELPFGFGFTVEVIAQQTILGLSNNGFEYENIISENNLILHGNVAFELEIVGKIKDRKVIVYLLTVAKGENAFTLIGIGKNDLERERIEFEELARTFELKY